MAKFKVNKTKDYTIMSNYHLKEKNMSLKAKGLLSVMLSLPENWDYSIAGLVSISQENESAIKSALSELKKNGYLEVIKLMPNESETGRIDYIYNIYEKPKQEGKKQGVDFLGVEFLGVENQGQYNTNNKILNNNINNNIKNYNKKEIALEKFEEFYKEYPKKVSKENVKKWFIKNNPSDELFKTIMSSLKKYKLSDSWKDIKYIPYPSTWLNQKRWEDELNDPNVPEWFDKEIEKEEMTKEEEEEIKNMIKNLIHN